LKQEPSQLAETSLPGEGGISLPPAKYGYGSETDYRVNLDRIIQINCQILVDSSGFYSRFWLDS
jgi:hypothetical protein